MSKVVHLCYITDWNIKCVCGFSGTGYREDNIHWVTCEKCLKWAVEFGETASRLLASKEVPSE